MLETDDLSKFICKATKLVFDHIQPNQVIEMVILNENDTVAELVMKNDIPFEQREVLKELAKETCDIDTEFFLRPSGFTSIIKLTKCSSTITC